MPFLVIGAVVVILLFASQARASTIAKPGSQAPNTAPGGGNAAPPGGNAAQGGGIGETVATAAVGVGAALVTKLILGGTGAATVGGTTGGVGSAAVGGSTVAVSTGGSGAAVGGSSAGGGAAVAGVLEASALSVESFGPGIIVSFILTVWIATKIAEWMSEGKTFEAGFIETTSPQRILVEHMTLESEYFQKLLRANNISFDVVEVDEPRMYYKFRTSAALFTRFSTRQYLVPRIANILTNRIALNDPDFGGLTVAEALNRFRFSAWARYKQACQLLNVDSGEAFYLETGALLTAYEYFKSMPSIFNTQLTGMLPTDRGVLEGTQARYAVQMYAANCKRDVRLWLMSDTDYAYWFLRKCHAFTVNEQGMNPKLISDGPRVWMPASRWNTEKDLVIKPFDIRMGGIAPTLEVNANAAPNNSIPYILPAYAMGEP